MTSNTQTTTIGDSTYQRIAHVIKQMEVDLGLLRDEPYGRAARLAWEASRFGVVTELKQRLCDHGVAHTPSDDYTRMDLPRFVRFCARVGTQAILRCPLFAPRGRKYLILPHTRRKLASDGVYEEPYTDQLIGMLKPRDYLILESPNNWRHLTPRRQPQPWYAESVMLIAKLLMLSLPRVRLLLLVRQMASDIETYLKNSLNIDVDVYSQLCRAMLKIAFFRRAYRLLLMWLRPKALVMVACYGKEHIVLAAKDLAILTIELQHGVVTPYHFGYVVPHGESKTTSPDYLLVFGTYWRDSVTFSNGHERIIPVGFPYFERESAKYKVVKKHAQIVFLSQGNIGDKLSRFAVEVSGILKNDFDVVYKLHPGEYRRWKQAYPHLMSAAGEGLITVIDTDASPLYGLLSESIWQVGVNSTSIFEGIGLNCQTVLVDLPGVEYMLPLIERNIVSVVSTPNELVSRIRKGHTAESLSEISAEFFLSNSATRLLSTIETIGSKFIC